MRAANPTAPLGSTDTYTQGQQYAQYVQYIYVHVEDLLRKGPVRRVSGGDMQG